MTSICPTEHKNFGKRGVRHRRSGEWGAAFLHPISKASALQQQMADASFSAIPSGFRQQKGIRLTPTGTWRARIWNPITQKCKEVGTYNTWEEAYTNRMLELEAMFPTMTTPNGQGQKEIKQGCSYCANTGKWGVSIRHPTTKALVWLGTYDDREEAKHAYSQKKLEIDSMLGRVRKKRQRKQDSVAGLRNVYERAPGRWYCMMKNPITKRSEYLGTYDTAEDAAEARDRKKREFTSLAATEKRIQGQNRTFDNAMQHQGALASELEAGNSKITVEYSQIPILRSVGREDSDMGVIDAYGRLIGEFSRIDDELWLV